MIAHDDHPVWQRFQRFFWVALVAVWASSVASPGWTFEPLSQSASLVWVDSQSGLASSTNVRTERLEVSDLLPIEQSLSTSFQQAVISGTGVTVELAARASIVPLGSPDFASVNANAVYEFEFAAEPGATYDLHGMVDVDYQHVYFGDIASVQLKGPGLDLMQSFSPQADQQYEYGGSLDGGTYSLVLSAFGAGALDAQWVERMTGVLQINDGSPHVIPTETPLYRLLGVERSGVDDAGWLNRSRTSTHETVVNATPVTSIETRSQSSWVSQRSMHALSVGSDLLATFEPLLPDPVEDLSVLFKLRGRFDGVGEITLERQADCLDCWEPIETISGLAGAERLFGKSYSLQSVPHRLTAVGNFDFTFVPDVPGDVNLDSFVDATDINLLTAEILAGHNRLEFDLDANGRLEQADRILWVEQLAGSTFGDADLNGFFDSADLILVFQANEYEDAQRGNSVWETGDWNGDAEFSTDDFIFALQRSRYESAAKRAVVPEPSGGIMWLVALLAMCNRSFRR